MAELKCIYGKACPKCDCSAKNKDMLHRFLSSLTDQKAWQQIKFVKDPGHIDKELDEDVKYRETHQSGNLTKKRTR